MNHMEWWFNHKWFTTWLIFLIIAFIVACFSYNPIGIGQAIGILSVFYWVILRPIARWVSKHMKSNDDNSE